MIRFAIQDQTLDAIILFSSDTDLLPALETIHRNNLCHIEVASWIKGNRLRFDGTQAPWCHNIDEKTFRTLEDTRDYAITPSGIPASMRPRGS